jgi:hypothetical protein
VQNWALGTEKNQAYLDRDLDFGTDSGEASTGIIRGPGVSYLPKFMT